MQKFPLVANLWVGTVGLPGCRELQEELLSAGAVLQGVTQGTRLLSLNCDIRSVPESLRTICETFPNHFLFVTPPQVFMGVFPCSAPEDVRMF